MSFAKAEGCYWRRPLSSTTFSLGSLSSPVRETGTKMTMMALSVAWSTEDHYARKAY
jgi:hypothetical protein